MIASSLYTGEKILSKMTLSIIIEFFISREQAVTEFSVITDKL